MEVFEWDAANVCYGREGLLSAEEIEEYESIILKKKGRGGTRDLFCMGSSKSVSVASSQVIKLGGTRW